MGLSDGELADLVTAVCADMLGVEITMRPERNGESLGDVEQLTGCIHISDGWSGSLLVEVEAPVAKELAAAMFGMDVADLTDDEVSDALGEVANMVGGNVKAVVGGAALSLPSVTSGRAFEVHVPGTVLEAQSAFSSGSGNARAVLLTRSDK